MKKRFMQALAATCAVIILGGCSSAGLSGVGNADSNSGSRDLRMNVTTSESSAWMICAEEFKKLVEEGTDGRYTISIYPNEQLSSGDQTKGVEMLFNGTTDIDMHSTMIISSYKSRMGAVSMPWLLDGYESVDAIVFNNGSGGQMLTKLMEDKGCHVLGLCENGFRQLTNNKRPVTTPDDMKGLKIRISSIPQYTELYKLMGADPVKMSFSEVFTALQQRALDGQENPYDFIRSGKIQEVQKYMTIWNYAYAPIILSCSSQLWDSLSEEDREIFQQAGEAACAKEVTEFREIDAEILKEFIKMKIIQRSIDKIEEICIAILLGFMTIMNFANVIGCICLHSFQCSPRIVPSSRLHTVPHRRIGQFALGFRFQKNAQPLTLFPEGTYTLYSNIDFERFDLLGGGYSGSCSSCLVRLPSLVSLH